MTMAVDQRQQNHFNAMSYDHLRYQAPAPPHFTNPWVSAPPPAQSQMYATSLPQTSDSQRYATANVSSAYTAAPMAAPSLASGILPVDPDLMTQSGLQMQQDGLTAPRPYGAAYTQASTGSTFAPTSAPQYNSAPYGYQADRRTSHPSVASSMMMGDTIQGQAPPQSSFIDINNRLNTATEAERQSFSDALDASRGMVAMSQSDITPRPIYGNAASSRSSIDSYGFPSSHSSHSSISSGSGYQNYYNSSVSEASVGDYSSASESVDMPSSRTLPRPNGLIGGTLPPAPHTMMGQFSSKVSSSSQKKHKCKICDKRFTRPSSLQTHMYSHTGEKPFACDVEGCGRHFSVVSNLRRHRKVHKGEGRDHPSPDDDDD